MTELRLGLTDPYHHVVAFITHHTALAVLLFGVITFLATQAQIDAVQALRKRSITSSQSAIAVSSSQLAQTLSTAALGQSQAYATDINVKLLEWQHTIDTTVFGPWFNTTTVVLNSTLVRFYDDLEKGEYDPWEMDVCD